MMPGRRIGIRLSEQRPTHRRANRPCRQRGYIYILKSTHSENTLVRGGVPCRQRRYIYILKSTVYSDFV